MPLPHFLLMICVILTAAGVTVWAATHVGIPFGFVALVALLAAGVIRLMGRVE